MTGQSKQACQYSSGGGGRYLGVVPFRARCDQSTRRVYLEHDYFAVEIPFSVPNENDKWNLLNIAGIALAIDMDQGVQKWMWEFRGIFVHWYKFLISVEIGAAWSENVDNGYCYRHYIVFDSKASSEAFRAKMKAKEEIQGPGRLKNLDHFYCARTMSSFTHGGGRICLWVIERDGSYREILEGSEEIQSLMRLASSYARERSLPPLENSSSSGD